MVGAQGAQEITLGTKKVNFLLALKSHPAPHHFGIKSKCLSHFISGQVKHVILLITLCIYSLLRARGLDHYSTLQRQSALQSFLLLFISL